MLGTMMGDALGSGFPLVLIPAMVPKLTQPKAVQW